MVLSFISCAFIKPYKYDLTPLTGLKRYYLYDNECVEQTIKTNKKGEFIGYDEKEVLYKTCFDDLLICYPKESEAVLESFIRSIFKTYIEF